MKRKRHGTEEIIRKLREAEQPILLGNEQRVLTVEFVALGLGVGLGVLGLRDENGAEPVAN